MKINTFLQFLDRIFRDYSHIDWEQLQNMLFERINLFFGVKKRCPRKLSLKCKNKKRLIVILYTKVKNIILLPLIECLYIIKTVKCRRVVNEDTHRRTHPLNKHQGIYSLTKTYTEIGTVIMLGWTLPTPLPVIPCKYVPISVYFHINVLGSRSINANCGPNINIAHKGFLPVYRILYEITKYLLTVARIQYYEVLLAMQHVFKNLRVCQLMKFEFQLSLYLDT